jgi:hypothetical protein
MRAFIVASVVASGIAVAAAPVPAAAEDPAYLVIGAGTWESMRDNNRTGEVDLAYRSDYNLWIFKPHGGLVIAADGDVFGYVGLLTDVYWGPHLVTTISAAFGGYGGHGFDLGSTFEFRTGGDIAWRFADASRLGIGFYHISNAGITQRNPGSESALLQYAYPLGPMFSTAAKPPTVATTQFSR